MTRRKTGRPRGRPFGTPTELTPETHAQIVQLARDGIRVTHIADSLGIHRSKIYEWLQKGEGKHESCGGLGGFEPYKSFALDYRKARADKTIELLREHDRIAVEENDTKAIQWRLGILDKVYRPAGRTELSGPRGGPLEIQPGVVLLPPLGEGDRPDDQDDPDVA